MTSHQIDRLTRRRRDFGQIVDLSWWVWFVAIASTFFLDSAQFLAAVLYMAAVMAYVFARPSVALKATLSYLVPWMYVLLALISVLWSQYSDWTLRASIQLAFTTGAALVMARALPARSLLTVYLSAILLADAASLLNPRMEWNAGQLAMVGIFGSKNSFGLAQALLIQFGTWVLLDTGQSKFARWLGLIGVLVGALLLVKALNMDAVMGLVGALGCSLLAFNLRRFPLGSRATILAGGSLVMAILCGFAIAYGDELFRAALQLTGKSVTLSDRTPLWNVAARMMQENPIGGVGFQAFWRQGNPFAENLWHRFNPSRQGYHFHNLWYQSGVDLGYIGLTLAILTVGMTTVEVVRWAVLSPNPRSCFFLGFVMFILLRSMLEVDLFAQYSGIWSIFVATWVYARQSRGLHGTVRERAGEHSISNRPLTSFEQLRLRSGTG